MKFIFFNILINNKINKLVNIIKKNFFIKLLTLLLDNQNNS